MTAVQTIEPASYLNDQLKQDIQSASYSQLLDWWEAIAHDCGDEGRRWLGQHDRFYLLNILLNRPDAFDPWLYVRCREVEANPDGHLDLWAREHYKSTIITFSGIIQEIVVDPEITIGVFSHTKSIARKFVQQVKYEIESNQTLIDLYDDIFYQNPQKEAERWSLDSGIVVKRSSNPKESTLEGHGLVDGMPTGSHFRLRVYDDVVTPASVTTPEQIKKTTESWALSDNLGAVTVKDDGSEVMRTWHIGTRYSFADTYQHILNEKILKPRVYAATDDGTIHGKPVFLSKDIWAHKLKTQTESVIACQQLQNPIAGNQAMFKKAHLRFMDIRPETLNVYLVVDPASSKKKGSDRTVMLVIGVDANLNKWLLDGYAHKMNLKERWTNLKNLRRRWLSMIGVQALEVGYEKYGMQSDIEYFETQMEEDEDAFDIKELNWTRDNGGQSKPDRVQRLYPDFASGKFFLPAILKKPSKTQTKYKQQGESHRIFAPTFRTDENGEVYSLNKIFLDEYLTFPFSAHDDCVDCASRIYDMDITAPVIIDMSAMQMPDTPD